MDSGGYSSKQEGIGYGDRVAPKVVNTTNANQYTTPAIQNGGLNARNVVYVPQQNQQQVAYMPVPQPQYIQNSNSFTEQVAIQKINNDQERIKQLTQEVVSLKNGQKDQEKKDSVFDTLYDEVSNDNKQKTMNFYTNQKKAEEENQKELDELRKYKKEQEKKEEAQRQKEELEKKFEDQESELKNRGKELDEREDLLYSMNLNSKADREEFASYKEKTGQVEDLQEYGETLKNFYEKQIEINDDEKKQKLKYIEDLEKETKTKIGQITSMEQDINNRKAGESIITKIINFLTGKRDKKSEELKEKIKKLTKDIKEGNTTIEQQKQELKAIEKKGLEMIKEKLDEMRQNSEDQIKDLKDKKQQYDAVKNSDEYKKVDKDIFRTSQLDRLHRCKEQIDLINSMSLKRSGEIYNKYSIEPSRNDSTRYDLNSINRAKGKDNGRW